MDYDMKVDRRIGETVLRQQLLNRLEQLRDRNPDAARTEEGERVQAALQRIAEGCFGRCIGCEQAISLVDLLAEPAIERCPGCAAANRWARAA